MKNKLVPIIYIGGIGGNFLSYVLDSALIRRDLADKPTFTKYGSGHLMHRYYVPYTQVTTPIEQQITSYLDFYNVKEFLEDDNSKNPIRDNGTMYVGFHSSDIDAVMKHAERAVLMTYDVSDISDIVTTYIGKRLLDGYYYPDGTRDYIPETNIEELAAHYHTHTKLLIDFQKSFVPRFDFGNRLLNISWTEMIRYPASHVVNRLSEFTGYEIDRFDADTITEWQNRTLYCINDLAPLIGKINGCS